MLQTQTNRLNPILLWAGGIVIVLLSIWGLRTLLRDRLPIVAAKVSYQDLVNTIPTNGKVEPYFSFESHAPFNGTVGRVYVQQGDVVPKGKLLLTLDDDDARSRLATALSNLRSAQASLDALQNGGTQDARISMEQMLRTEQMQVAADTQTLANVKGLMAAGAASQSEVNAAQQRLQAAENNLAATRQRKSGDYTAAELARAKAQLADAKTSYDVAEAVVQSAHVVAPFAGTVYSLSVGATNYVSEGQELLQVADLSHLRVHAYFDEPDIGKLAVGQPVTIHWDAKPGLSWRGHVERTPSDITNYGTRNVGEVLVAIDDPPGPLLPNTNVTLSVTVLDRKNVLSIPRSALHTEGPENYVYKVVNNRLARTSVQVGDISLINVEIRGGLKENDIIALGANSTEPLADGAEVRIVK